MKGLPILTDDTITRFWSLGHRNMKWYDSNQNWDEIYHCSHMVPLVNTERQKKNEGGGFPQEEINSTLRNVFKRDHKKNIKEISIAMITS